MLKSVIIALTFSLFLAACGPSDFEKENGQRVQFYMNRTSAGDKIAISIMPL